MAADVALIEFPRFQHINCPCGIIRGKEIAAVVANEEMVSGYRSSMSCVPV